MNILLGLAAIVITVSLSYTAAKAANSAAGYAIAASGLSVTIPMVAGGAGLIMLRHWGRRLSLAAAYIMLTLLIIYLSALTGMFLYFGDMLQGADSVKLIKPMAYTAALFLYPVTLLIFLHSGKVKLLFK